MLTVARLPATVLLRRVRLEVAMKLSMVRWLCVVVFVAIGAVGCSEDESATGGSGGTGAVGGIAGNGGAAGDGGVSGVGGSQTRTDPLEGIGTVELVADGFSFTEGPTWRSEDQTLLFTDIPANTIHELTPPSTIEVFRDDSVRLLPLPWLLQIAGMLLLAWAMARPAERVPLPRESKGIDIVLCLDVSSSMKANDLAADRTRLDVAKGAAAGFVAGRREDRIGLVSFARFPDLRCPPTRDHDALGEFLRDLAMVEGDGPEDATGIGAAVARAAQVLQSGAAQAKVIILLTDGEENIATAEPIFWLGLLLILVFSINLGWFPTTGTGGWRGLVLPAFTLGFVSAALISRLTRSSLLEVMQEDYVRTARSKGLNGWRVLIGHALKNALIPVVTILGLQFGNMLAGAVVTETVFSRPGLGRLVVNAILWKDFPLIQGTVLFIAVMYVLVNLIVDVSYAWIDPRIHYG